MTLADHACVLCPAGTLPLDANSIADLLTQVGSGWQLNADGHLQREYGFGNFVAAMAFANRVADVAEAENHHPDLTVRWGRCKVEIWTHKIGGLTESDFFFAAKADRAFELCQSK